MTSQDQGEGGRHSCVTTNKALTKNMHLNVTEGGGGQKILKFTPYFSLPGIFELKTLLKGKTVPELGEYQPQVVVTGTNSALTIYFRSEP